MTRVFASLIAVMVLVAGAVTVSGQTEDMQATAVITNADGQSVGTATFTEIDAGVKINVQLTDLEPGARGIHLHESGVCEPPDFQSAGGHFNPDDQQHGLENPEGPHAGDLPNIEIDEDGTGTLNYVNELITLGDGENSIVDGDGTAIVIHANEDDQVTDPSGESGDRIACGVVMLADEDGDTATPAATPEADDEEDTATPAATPETDDDAEETDGVGGPDSADQVMPGTGGPAAALGGQISTAGLLVVAAGLLALMIGLFLRRRIAA